MDSSSGEMDCPLFSFSTRTAEICLSWHCCNRQSCKLSCSTGTHLHLLTQLFLQPFSSMLHTLTTFSINLGPGLTLWGISHQSSNSLLKSNPQTKHQQDAAALSSQGTSFSSSWLTAGLHGRIQQKGDLTFLPTLPWPLLMGISRYF